MHIDLDISHKGKKERSGTGEVWHAVDSTGRCSAGFFANNAVMGWGFTTASAFFIYCPIKLAFLFYDDGRHRWQQQRGVRARVCREQHAPAGSCTLSASSTFFFRIVDERNQITIDTSTSSSYSVTIELTRSSQLNICEYPSIQMNQPKSIQSIFLPKRKKRT